MIHGWRDEAYYRSDPWRGTWSGEGGGVLVNQAVHQIDLLLWFLGQPVENVVGIARLAPEWLPSIPSASRTWGAGGS